MELISRMDSGVQVLAANGRIDHSRASAFEAGLAPFLQNCCASHTPLVLDFSGVDFISSVGLRVLMLAAKQVKAQRGKIAVASLSPIVSEIFQVSRFNLVLDVFESTEVAISTLTP